MYGEFWRKNAPFLVLKLFVCHSIKFHPYKPYISEISNHYSIFWAYKNWNFQNFNFGLECLSLTHHNILYAIPLLWFVVLSCLLALWMFFLITSIYSNRAVTTLIQQSVILTEQCHKWSTVIKALTNNTVKWIIQVYNIKGAKYS